MDVFLKISVEIISYKGYFKEFTSTIKLEEIENSFFTLVKHYKNEAEKDDDFGDVRKVIIRPRIHNINEISIEF